MPSSPPRKAQPRTKSPSLELSACSEESDQNVSQGNDVISPQISFNSVLHQSTEHFTVVCLSILTFKYLFLEKIDQNHSACSCYQPFILRSGILKDQHQYCPMHNLLAFSIGGHFVDVEKFGRVLLLFVICLYQPSQSLNV